MDKRDAIARIRDVRREISNAHDNDSKKLLAYYRALQEQHRQRLIECVDSELVGDATNLETTEAS